MLLIRIVGLMVIVCLHVFGGAVLFRRIFPRESVWWGFFIPALGFVALLNFIEHIVPLPRLEMLLPFTSGLLAFALANPRFYWRKFWFPALLFLASFGYALAAKCLQPDVNFYCTEGLTDLNRILDFCLGDRLPAADCWLPPYPHVGYYTFMHYGASVMKRLLYIDIGTGYNFGFAFTNALALMACAAAGHSLSRNRNWIAAVMLMMLAAGFTGSTPIKAIMNPMDANPVSSIDISGNSDNQALNGFTWLLKRSPPQDAFRIYTPGCYIYYTEFHATLGGEFVILLTTFAAAEALRRKRTIFPWIFLIVAPVLAIITCPWYFFMVTVLSAPTLLLAWWIGRKPPNWNHVLVGGAIGLALLWPTLSDFSRGSVAQDFHWDWDPWADRWMIFIQWWPIYVPWLLLCLVWKRMSVAGRWLHFVMIPIFIVIEIFYFSSRGTCLEKTWGGFFGMGVAVVYPLFFAQKGWFYRIFSGAFLLMGLLCVWAWVQGIYGNVWHDSFLHLEGDYFIEFDPQLERMSEVLSRVHAQTVLTGVSREAFFESPALPAFTENRSFLGWTNAEETAGHPTEAHERGKLTNSFYDGTMTDKLGFLHSYNITAMLVWPDDKLTDDFLGKLKMELAPEFAYFDCKGDGPHNAGVFLKKTP